MSRLLRYFLLSLLVLAFSAPAAFAQSGKISGQVTDAATGDPLPGVNVIIQGTQQGATTNVDGYYTILNVSAGTYNVQASFVGYAKQTVEGVRVNIDLTTTQNFALQEQTVGLDEVTVQATEPVVKPDVSANVANLDAQEFENIPVAGVEEVLNLQAGIEPGLSVRGGGRDELQFVVDGMSMRTGRNNQPFTGISYTSVKEMQVQTGGFSAEYGNVRSGLINVVTKDAPRSRYTVDALVRYQPAQAKSSGGLPEDPDSYYMRPFLPDPDIPDDRDPAFVGVDSENSAWDKYTARQYSPHTGWNSKSEEWAGLENRPNLTPQQLVELFKWRTRKNNKIQKPDYIADISVGGPLVPGLSSKLGDLRFLASYRQTQTAYFYNLQRDTYDERTGQLKLVTNFSPSMKLGLRGMYGEQLGMNNSPGRGSVGVWDGSLPAYAWGWAPSILRPGRRAENVFSPHAANPVDITHALVGGDFTHTLSQNTFYEVGMQRMFSTYRHHMPRARDQTKDAFCIEANAEQQAEGNDQFCFDEAPYGFAGEGGNFIGGFTTGGHWAKTRDTSDVAIWKGYFDVTSQLNRFSQLKAGLDLIYNNYDIRWERQNIALAYSDFRNVWQRQPLQGAAYVQNKLEFEGMVANVGLRLDYMDANAMWWQYEPYDRAFAGKIDGLNEALEKQQTDPQFSLSPRLGLSFPVTTDSKVYLNYGHFRQMLNARDMFGIESSDAGGIDRIGNPNHPMPKTVAYELGYDQNLFDMFLFRVSGFYRDVQLQPRNVSFENLDGSAQYVTQFPWNYEDIRGVEFSLNKNGGRWFRGFINYTFMARKSGNFKFSQFNENAFQQREYLRKSTDYRIWAPVAEPYARVSLELVTPQDFGPALMNNNVLGDWRVNLLGGWRDGQTFTWGGGGSYPELRNNVTWRDHYNFDLRLTKNINFGGQGNVQMFADISNIFNMKNIYRNTSFLGTRDFFYYMTSLHLPEGTFSDLEEDAYNFVYGKDQPGDFRKPGVGYQPVEVVSNLSTVGEDKSSRAYYYSKDKKDYFRWDAGAWKEVSDGEVQEMIDTKAYIDMPNAHFATFLNPRRVLFGLRVSF